MTSRQQRDAHADFINFKIYRSVFEWFIRVECACVVTIVLLKKKYNLLTVVEFSMIHVENYFCLEMSFWILVNSYLVKTCLHSTKTIGAQLFHFII